MRASDPTPGTFRVGQKAVYPAQGLGVIKQIAEREIHGTPQSFYVFQVEETGLRILVPIDKADAVGLRPVAGPEEVEEVMAIIRENDAPLDRHTWNRRYRGFVDKVKSGSLFEVAEVYRDLHRLHRKKVLSFGERRMLDTAESLIVKELAAACGTDPATIAARLERELERSLGGSS